jgi:aminoglycoside phosphotransferase (APT) family kinase protein
MNRFTPSVVSRVRELHRRRRETMRAAKRAHGDRVDTLAEIQTFCEQNRLSAREFSRIAHGRYGGKL